MLLLISFIIVVLGHFQSFSLLGVVTAFCGYALFWKGLTQVKKRFWVGAFWFALLQGCYLFWMTSIEYQGVGILFVYLLLILGLGAQFGALSVFVLKEELTFFRILVAASFWVLMEWGRLFVLCGFAFNPLGLCLGSNGLLANSVSLFGVLGASFFVVFINLCVFSFFAKRNYKFLATGVVLFLSLWGYGTCHFLYHDAQIKSSMEKPLHVALIQTGLLPSEKVKMSDRLSDFVHPLEQWQRIFTFLEKRRGETLDYIILPEAALPFGFSRCVYSLPDVQMLLKKSFGSSVETAFPAMGLPYAKQNAVSNAYILQTLSSYFKAEVIAGLDDEHYNAAFHFTPLGVISRYEKQILLPLAEYLPLQMVAPFAEKYGINQFFMPGKESKVFEGRVPLSLSICYEEMFSSLMRKGRERGAKLFINVTNDNWFPSSILPDEHFKHAQLRSIENGVVLLRSCNNGVTCILDSLGRKVSFLNHEEAGILLSSFVPYSYKTPYSFWGDYPIVFLSFLFCFSYFLYSKNFIIFFKGFLPLLKIKN